MSELTFQEVRRSVQALSSIYVENRGRIESRAPFDGAGKRAAFAMFYAPLHFLLIREIVRALGASHDALESICDLGCGTGCASAAWAQECSPKPKVTGVDRNAWALQECRWTYGVFEVRGTTRAADLRTFKIPPDAAVVAAFTINELDTETRDRFLHQFLNMSKPVLIVEPIARRLTNWWDEWAREFRAVGGRDDQWRFTVDLPEKLKLMDRAAGLDHRELTARSLWLPDHR